MLPIPTPKDLQWLPDVPIVIFMFQVGCGARLRSASETWGSWYGRVVFELVECVPESVLGNALLVVVFHLESKEK